VFYLDAWCLVLCGFRWGVLWGVSAGGVFFCFLIACCAFGWLGLGFVNTGYFVNSWRVLFVGLVCWLMV